MDKHRKKQLKKYISWGAAAALVLILAVMPLIASQNTSADGPQASILRAAVEAKDIETQLIGGGQLSSNATEEITIPAEIKLTEYLVSNGDIVKKGDAIAALDKVSVLTALSEVQETLNYLSEEIADASNDSDSEVVKAHAGGLVKILYGQKGDSVRDVMLRHGALAVLSLDGRMAVDIDRSTDLKAGSAVCVYLEDDTEVEGKVESSAGGTLTVSIQDDGYEPGEKVVVKTEEGKRLGSGTLYIHNAWNATAYYGTISGIKAKEGDTLSAGKTLFTLETGDYSAQFQILAAQRQEYEELMLELFRMYDSGVITAPCDGIITGVDDDGSFLLAAGEERWQLQLLENMRQSSQPSYSIILLSNETPGDTQDPEEPETPDTPDPADPPEEPDVPTAPTYTVTVGQVNAAGTVDLSYTYAGISSLDSVPTTFTPTGKTASWPLTGLLNRDLTAYSGTAAAGNILFEVTSSDGSTFYVFAAVAAPSQQAPGNSQQPQQGSMSGMMGAMGGGSIQVFEPYSLDTLTIATVTSQEEMTLEITVDEQDIASVHTGQEATVTVEALTGQNFPATVTAIGNTGTNEGGSSKFTATLTLSKSGDMLPGMNASAYLTLNTARQVLTIPVAALIEEGTRTLVYTGYQEKDNQLSNPVEVTTGVSDGEFVEILSGLNAGDAVYYAYYDTLEISNSPDPVGFGF